jgi:PPOX class probable F420-dependent enzyme
VTAADLDLVRRLAAADRGLAVVAVGRADGSAHASLVNAGVLDDPENGGPAVAFVVRGGARKLDYLRQRARATVVFRSAWEWVAVEGSARIIGPDDLPEALPALLRAVFAAAGGTHDDWDTFDRVMADERRVAVFVQPARITTN